jgi:hypothetical protein
MPSDGQAHHLLGTRAIDAHRRASMEDHQRQLKRK